jgi:hypothetical protein
MVLLFAIAAALPLHFHVDATEFANTVYQTTCVTGRITCSRAIYHRFWDEKYHATEEDHAKFQEFGAIFDELESTAPQPPPTPFLSNDFSYVPRLKIRNSWVAAALASKSPADFRKRATALGKPQQAEKLAAILAYFQGRLHPWWVATGLPILKDRFPGIEKSLRTQHVPELAIEVAAFLEASPTSRDYYLHTVPNPEYDGDEGNGTMVLNQFALEVSHRIKPDDLGWIAIHEFTHSAYEQAPQPRKDALMQQFVDSGDAAAQPLYLYLNEAMATAVELLLAERNGKTIEEPYTELYIPRLAKAALPLLRTALQDRKTLYDGFTAPYLAAGRAALGAEADGLQFRYSCVALLADPDVRNAFLDRLPLRYFVDSRETWDRYSHLDGILILRYDQIHFDGNDAGLQSLMEKHRGIVYIRHDERNTVFMLARDNATLDQLGKLWAESKEPAHEGLIFTIE